MPRAIVLVTTTAGRVAVERALTEVQCDLHIMQTTGAIIESWARCVGNADFVIRVFGMSLQSIILASSTIRDELSEKLGHGHRVYSGSILCSSLLEPDNPQASSEFVRKLKARVQDALSDGPDENVVKPTDGESEMVLLGLMAVYENVNAMSAMLDMMARTANRCKAPLQNTRVLLSKMISEITGMEMGSSIIEGKTGTSDDTIPSTV